MSHLKFCQEKVLKLFGKAPDQTIKLDLSRMPVDGQTMQKNSLQRAKQQKLFTNANAEFLTAVICEFVNYSKKSSLHFPMFHF